MGGGAGICPVWRRRSPNLPVIGVPVKTSALGGRDSLLSIVQMPAGVPVATVAINGAKNAAILAAQILGLADPAILTRSLPTRSLEAMVMEKVEQMAADEAD